MDRGRTGIINQALLYAGQDTIVDPLGESKNAKLCEAVYADTLAEVLCGHPWTFATTAAALRRLAEAPADARFRHAYQLPADCGRIVQVTSRAGMRGQWARRTDGTATERANTLPAAEYCVQGDRLFSNLEDLQLVYVRTAADPSVMTPQFRNYFAAVMAEKLALKISGSMQLAQQMFKIADNLRLEAIRTDGEQTDTMPQNRPNLFVAVREY